MLNMSLSRLVFIADKERTVNTAFSKFSSLLVGNAGARDDRIAALEAKVDQFQLQLEKVSRTKDVEGKSGPKITVSRRQGPTYTVGNTAKVQHCSTFKRFVVRALPYMTHHLNANQVLAFNKITTNLGSAYHASGHFIAPVKGLYVFTVSVVIFTKEIFLHLKVDGQTYGVGYVDTRVATGDYRVGSYTWVVELNPSSMVWLENIYDTEFHGNGLTYFSGFLLYETEVK